MAALEREGPEEGDERREPGDYASEGLYQDELDAGRAQGLRDRLDAVERAEARIADGTYGLSVAAASRFPTRALRPTRPPS